MEMPQIYRPIPRRNFEITPASTDSSHPPSPTPETPNPELLVDRRLDVSSTPSRTRSILNLTSSTLFGIYSPTGHDSGRDDPPTPWGTGAQTPSQRRSMDDYRPQETSLSLNGHITQPHFKARRQRTGFRKYYLPLALQTVLLFAFGAAYGAVITQLSKKQQINPVPIPAVAADSTSYPIIWGVLGILLGNALPLVDSLWEEDINPKQWKDLRAQHQARDRTRSSTASDSTRISSADSGVGPIWYSAVRSIGAFVGIAFAVRKVPWQSTLQVSLTLALANPVLWYLIDRSMPGFVFSTAVGIVGTVALLLVNPNFVPVPAIHQAVVSEQIGVYAWLASILFCTSLCFGAIGRKLQL